MSSTIEVLESNLKQVKKAYKNFGDYSSAGIVIDKNLINALDEAIVALEQKESDKGWVCDVCDRETASCLSLCPDCNDRKQGALEELWLIGKELTSFIGGDKSTNIERNRINNYIEKRIKELEGVEKEWV